MDESILNSIKQMLGIYPEDTAFDPELISFINGAIADLLHVCGFDPNWGFLVTDSGIKWSALVHNDAEASQAKQYVYCKVRLLFDPPSNSFVVDSISKSKDEAQWRFYEMTHQEGLNGTD